MAGLFGAPRFFGASDGRHVWLLHFDRVAGGRVDSFRAIKRRLSGLLFGLVVGVCASLGAVPSSVRADEPTEAAAYANCMATYVTGKTGGSTCTDLGQLPSNHAFGQVQAFNSQGASIAQFLYQWGTSNPCLQIAPIPQTVIYDQSAPLRTGQSFPELSPASYGGQVSCAVVVTVIGTPVHDPNTGKWTTVASFIPSGNLANGTGVTDGDGGSPTPAPSIPTLPAVNVTVPPQVCGGGSCYNASTNSFTAVGSDGTQYTVSASTAETSSGGCSGGNGGAICAGSPQAPTPPASLVPDPATQAQASDTYPVASPTTGATQAVNVAVYNAPGGTTTSGAKPGDSVPKAGSGTGPAGASTAAGAGNYAGGTDCVTPPSCSGDNVVCGAALTQWSTTCKVNSSVNALTTALAGANPTQQPPTFASDQTKYSQSSVWATPSVGNTQGDQANAGTYNQGGFGYNTQCPIPDFTFTSIGLTVPMSKGCTPLGYCYWIIVGFALYKAAKITAGSNAE